MQACRFGELDIDIYVDVLDILLYICGYSQACQRWCPQRTFGQQTDLQVQSSFLPPK